MEEVGIGMGLLISFGRSIEEKEEEVKELECTEGEGARIFLTL
jgi:hypothetical protein